MSLLASRPFFGVKFDLFTWTWRLLPRLQSLDSFLDFLQPGLNHFVLFSINLGFSPVIGIFVDDLIAVAAVKVAGSPVNVLDLGNPALARRRFFGFASYRQLADQTWLWRPRLNVLSCVSSSLTPPSARERSK